MSKYLMTRQIQLWDGITANQVDFPTITASTVGTAVLTSGGDTPLGFYDGNALANFKYKWPAESKILIEQIRISVPLWRGASYSVNPSNSAFNKFELKAKSITTLDVTNLYYNIGNYEEWVPVNQLVSSPTAGEDFQIDVVSGITIYFDFRNVQAIYDGLSPKLLVECLISSPYDPEV